MLLGKIDIPSFWSLAGRDISKCSVISSNLGAEVKYYTTTTFMHSKYMQADNSRASISSINFSHQSFMKNREAGYIPKKKTIYLFRVIIEGSNTAPALKYLTQVFEYDFKQGMDWPILSYDESDMEVITDK